MSQLTDKYQALSDAATAAGATNWQVREQDNVLYIDGDVPTEDVKKQLWDEYNKLDPDFKSGDLVMNLTVAGASAEPEDYTVASGDNLSHIAKKFNTSWKAIYDANKDVIGDNPNLIKVGQTLKIPK